VRLQLVEVSGDDGCKVRGTGVHRRRGQGVHADATVREPSDH
jgi:hypothetical protein